MVMTLCICYIFPGEKHILSLFNNRSLAAFLNSGRGGTAYLGIIDEGVVKGLYLTEYQVLYLLIFLVKFLDKIKIMQLFHLLV